MKTSLLALPLIATAVLAQESSPKMSITRAASQSAVAGSSEFFTGQVRIEAQFQGSEPSRVTVGIVTFEPGARSAWHTHPLGQTLVVTAGVGLVQEWNGEIQEIKAGDIIWTPPGVKHWHGATARDRMTHIAIQEKQDGTNVAWLEHVTDAQYCAHCSSR